MKRTVPWKIILMFSFSYFPGLRNRSGLWRECNRKLHPRGGHEEAKRFRNSIRLGRGLHIGRFGLRDEEFLRVSNHRNRSR